VTSEKLTPAQVWTRVFRETFEVLANEHPDMSADLLTSEAGAKAGEAMAAAEARDIEESTRATTHAPKTRVRVVELAPLEHNPDFELRVGDVGTIDFWWGAYAVVTDDGRGGWAEKVEPLP
jgi:hypothetical protein